MVSFRSLVVCPLAFALAFPCAHAASAGPFQEREPTDFAAALLVEHETRTVLYQYRPNLPRSPASTQKLLLQLVVMEAVAGGRYSLADSVYTSAWARRMGGSQVYLKEGEVFTLADLMEAIVISSANDACVAVAEHLGGSVEGFVALMNERARSLGLSGTECVNVHGLDDTPGDHRNVSTAADLAHIAHALIEYPDILRWSSVRYKPFRGGDFTLYTTNKLVGKFPDLDGLKTGYTDRAGFCLVATAERRDMRLVSVVLGASSEKARDRQTRRLLSWGFNHFVKVPIVEPDEPMGKIALDWGLQPEVTVVTTETMLAVLTDGQRRRLRREVELAAELPAPVARGDSLGILKITIGDSLLARVHLVAADSVGRMSVWEKFISYF